MEIIAFIALVVSIAGYFSLSGRIDQQAHEIEALKGGKAVPAASPAQHGSMPNVPPPIHGSMPTAVPGYQPSQSASEPAFIAWVKKDFFVKLGAFLMLIAAGWFVSYAFTNDWIGPVGRIALGLTLGAGVIGLGVWRMKADLNQGAIFLVLGSAIVLLTVYAAREVYGFFTPTTSLLLMFAVAVFVAVMSVQRKHEPLALSGLLVAALAPMLTVAPEPDLMGLYSYLLIVMLGTLWVVHLTGSRSLITASLIIMLVYSVPFIFDSLSAQDEITGLLFAFTFTILFFVANIVSIVYRDRDDARQGHVVAALLTGLYLMLWVTCIAQESWQGTLFALWALIFMLGTWFVYLRTSYKVPAYIYGAVSIALLGAATAAELSGPTLTIAYIVEVAVLVWAALYVLSNKRIAQYLCTLFVLPVLLTFEHIDSSSWDDGIWHSDFAVLALLTVALGSTAYLLYNKVTGMMKEEINAANILTLLGSFYALGLVWLTTHALLATDTATMVSLVAYTIIGLTTYVLAREREYRALQIAGGVLLGFVVLRLLTVEVWDMEIVGRIITFFAIGVLLMSTAFLGKKS